MLIVQSFDYRGISNADLRRPRGAFWLRSKAGHSISLGRWESRRYFRQTQYRGASSRILLHYLLAGWPLSFLNWQNRVYVRAYGNTHLFAKIRSVACDGRG